MKSPTLKFASVREINAACYASYWGRNGGRNVYAKVDEEEIRISLVRTVKGVFQVRDLNCCWHDAKIEEVYEK